MPRYNTVLATGQISGAATISSPYQGAFTQLAGTGGYTVTLPNPGLFPGSNQTFYNATSPAGVVTLSTPNGVFTGTGGPGVSTFNISAGNVVSVTSDGANYIVISEDGSPLTATTGAFTSDVSITAGITSITPTTFTLSPSGSGTINNVSIGNTTRSTGAFTALSANQQTSLTANIASSSTTTGSLVVTGGIGASGQVTASTLSATTLTGTLSTASQPNVTSLGTLTSLTTNALTVNGVSSLNGRTTAKDTINADASYPFGIQNGSQQQWWLRAQTTSNTFALHLNGTGDLVIVNTSGNVGIGASTPVAKLDVRGTVSTGGPIWLGSAGDNSAYDNVNISYTGFNGGSPQTIFQPRTTPGSGIINSSFYFKNSNGTSTSSNNTANVQVDNNISTLNGYISQGNGLYAEKTFDLGYFPNGSANQVVYLNFGNNFLNGNLEVTITSTYSFQNATGILRKVFSFGFNPNNSQWFPATSRVSEADGPIRDNIVIGEMEWDSVGSQYRLPIYHVVSTGNSFYAHVRALGGGNVIPYITVSGFSTRSSPTTAAASNFINIAGKRLYRDGDIAMWNGAATPATLSTIVSNNNDWVGFSDRYNSDSTVFEVVGSTPYGIRIKKSGWVYYYYDQDVISSGSSGYVTIRSAKNGSILQYQLITNTNGQWDGLIIGGAVSVAANDVINFAINAADITALDGGTWTNCSLIWYGTGS